MGIKKLSNLIQYVKEELRVIALFFMCCILAMIEEGTHESKNKQERIGETIIQFGDTLTNKEYNTDHRYYILPIGLIFKY